jgi:predicted dinucleotide-binding enzyme
MRIGVLGTGMVGTTIGTKLVALGHDVRMGARKAGNEKAVAWAARVGKGASAGTFADAAAFGEIVFNCTLGAAAVDAVKAAGEKNLAGKILIDTTVPLDLSRGFPPAITMRGEDSLGEQIQAALPGTRVVKTLNTINCNVMVDPGRIAGEHDVFVSGNDADAKATVTGILKDWFGWKSVVDLGDISTARGTEGYILMWLRLYGALKTADFNIKVVR